MKYVLTLAAALFASTAFGADKSWDVRQVAVSGEGSVEVTPDNAYISISVVTDADTVKASMKSNNERMTKAITLLKGTHSIAEADLCTHGFAVYPQYSKDKEDGNYMKIVGWETANHLTITVKDVSKAGDIMGSLGEIKSMRIDSIHFIVSEKLKDSVLDKAREAAVKDAKSRAALYAKAAGATLGDVVTIVEQGSGRSPYYADRVVGEGMTSSGPGGVPVSRGVTKVKVNVAVTFLLK